MWLHKLPEKLEKSSRPISVCEERYLEGKGNDKPLGVGGVLGVGEKGSWESLRGA